MDAAVERTNAAGGKRMAQVMDIPGLGFTLAATEVRLRHRLGSSTPADAHVVIDRARAAT